MAGSMAMKMVGLMAVARVGLRAGYMSMKLVGLVAEISIV